MKIIISSAVELPEKTCVKRKLEEMQEHHLLKIDEIYDCNEHGTFWDNVSKQEEINKFIFNADWFICLVPDYTVGQATRGELEYVIDKKLQGSPIQISVFHPMNFPEHMINHNCDSDRVTFTQLQEMAQEKLGNKLEHYFEPFEHNNIDDLCKKVEEVFNKAYFNDKAFWSQHIGYYSKKGNEISASNLYFDEKRSSLAWGFKEGKENYIWRNSVDGKLQYKLEDDSTQFLFVTGKPTSGKTRAIYECLHTLMKDANVVIMKSSNITSICHNLEIEIAQYEKDNHLPKRFKENTYYFVCDQITDVFKQAQVSDQMRYSFLKIISTYKNCKLLASGTQKSLYNFVEDSDGIISRFSDSNNGGNSDIITIPTISKDIDSQDILAKLRQRYNSTDGETIGDFIKELKKQKESIVKDIHEKAQKDNYLSYLLKSIQLTLVYRNITPLLIPITILRKFYPMADATEFKEKTIACIDFLIRKDVIKISDTTAPEKEISSFPRNHFTDSLYCVKTHVDDEEYQKIIPEIYTFTENELVWDYLEQEATNNPDTAILYDLYNEEDLENAIPILFESYPHAATLRRIVARVPIQQNWTDKQGNETRKRIAWDYAWDMLNSMDLSRESQAELHKLSNILIGRAESIKNVDDILKLIREKQIEINGSTIGEMYHFAKNKLTGNDLMCFLENIEKIDKEQQKNAIQKGCVWTYNDFYKTNWQIRFFSDDYDKAYNYAFLALHNITYKDNNGKTLKGKDAVNYISRKNDSVEKHNLDMMMTTLSDSCKTAKNIDQLIRCLQYYGIEPSSYILHRIGNVLGNFEATAKVIDTLLPSKKVKSKNRTLYEQMTCCFLIHMSNFKDSVRLYNKWHDDLEMGNNHNTRFVSLCLKNCKKEEFQSAIAFINSIPKDVTNGITYNLLISLASAPEDIIYILNRMKDSDIDEYTLSNCLKCIIRKNARFSHLQIFIMAYELINHPKLKPVSSRMACLQKLFEVVFDKYQDEYVCKLAGSQDYKYNDFINTTRIKSYRNFSEAYTEIYEPAWKKYIDIKGTFQPDLFCAMCSKYFKDHNLARQENASKYKEKLEQDIQIMIDGKRGAKIVRDEFFFMNYHIKFLGDPLFSDDGQTMSLLFLDWFNGNQGNYNPLNLSIISRYIEYFLSLSNKTVEQKWIMAKTLYSFYQDYYRNIKKSFIPDDLVFVNMLKIAEKHPDKIACLKFIDHEMIEKNIKWTPGINQYIKKNKALYHFEYSNTSPYNRQEENLEIIQKAGDTDQVLSILKKEINIEGFVSPSVINHALSKYRDFQRIHNNTVSQFIDYSIKFLGEKPTFFNLTFLATEFQKTLGKKSTGEILKVINCIKKHVPVAKNWEDLKNELLKLCNQLDNEELLEMSQYLPEKLTFRGLTLKTILTKNREERISLLNSLKELQDISENAYGMLAIEPIIAQTDMSQSRYYFKKWLGIYLDIYHDEDILAIKLTKEHSGKWNTIGRHFKNEIKSLEILRKRSKLFNEEQLPAFYAYLKEQGELDILSVITSIMKLYHHSTEHFKHENLSETIKLKDVVILLSLHNGNKEFWENLQQELQARYNLNNNIEESAPLTD